MNIVISSAIRAWEGFGPSLPRIQNSALSTELMLASSGEKSSPRGVGRMRGHVMLLAQMVIAANRMANRQNAIRNERNTITRPPGAHPNSGQPFGPLTVKITFTLGIFPGLGSCGEPADAGGGQNAANPP